MSPGGLALSGESRIQREAQGKEARCPVRPRRSQTAGEGERNPQGGGEAGRRVDRAAPRQPTDRVRRARAPAIPLPTRGWLAPLASREERARAGAPPPVDRGPALADRGAARRDRSCAGRDDTGLVRGHARGAPALGRPMGTADGLPARSTTNTSPCDRTLSIISGNVWAASAVRRTALAVCRGRAAPVVHPRLVRRQQGLSLSPVTRLPFLVSDGHDENAYRVLTIHDETGKARQSHTMRAMKGDGPSVRRVSGSIQRRF